MASGIPGPTGKAEAAFPEKGACISHQWTAQGCLAFFWRGQPVTQAMSLSLSIPEGL